MTRLKICGLRDAKHALVSAKAGADFLGFNFVPGVRRQISTERAQEIIASYRQTYGEGGPRLVGLFADQPLDDVNRIVASCGLDMAQLCGDEDAEYWGQVSVPLIKQIKVRDAGDPTSTVEQVALTVESVVASGHIAVLDSYEAGSLGGTGMTFDWSIAREVAGRHDIVLAGGLKPEDRCQCDCRGWALGRRRFQWCGDGWGQGFREDTTLRGGGLVPPPLKKGG